MNRENHHIHRIIRSRRKSLTIQVDERGNIIVRAPSWASDRYVQSLVDKKQTWIDEKLNLVRKRREQGENRNFDDGDRYLLLGKWYPLRVQDSLKGKPYLCFDGKCFTIDRSEHHRVRELMIEWYRDRARTIVAELVSTQADRMGLSIRGIRITGAQRRWGSCSSSGNLNFSYRIVMAPEEVIRYVVVHELSHLVEQNHSQRFWSLLERIMPEYRKHRSWLRENGYTLTL